MIKDNYIKVDNIGWIKKEDFDKISKKMPKKDKLWLKALSGAAGLGLGFGTTMITSGIPATIAVGAGIAAVKIYSDNIAPKVIAKIEKTQSAKNYAKEHPIKNAILNGVKKVNKFLHSGYGQWFVNGFGLGYVTSNLYKNVSPATSPSTPGCIGWPPPKSR